MKTLTRSLFLLLILVLNHSCRKWKNEIISGTVLDDSTHLTVSNAQVGLYDYHDHSTNNLILLKKATTGSDGKFVFEYNLTRKKPYAVIVQKDGYPPRLYSFTQYDQTENLIVLMHQ